MGAIAEQPRVQQTAFTQGIPWAAIGWFLGLLILAYAPVLARLLNQWNDDEDMGHGFFVPVLAGYIIWTQRDQLLKIKPEPTWFGLVVVAWGAAQLIVATLGAELFLARTAFLISLVGCILYLGGMPFIRALAFPLLLLVFMVPIPAIIYNQITFPLQLLASSIAEKTLNFVGIPVFREGNVLETPTQRLSVVEACSGIRSLLSLSFLSLVYAYFFDRRVWMRWALLILVVPIAIIANAGRVTLTGLLGEIDPKLSEGFYHTAQGWIVFMAALVMMVIVHQIINRLAPGSTERQTGPAAG